MPITALVAALLAPLYILLAFRVIGVRQAGKISVGDGGDKSLLRRIRVHANFAEYVPYALLLLAFAESLRAPPWILFISGACLLVGRYIHALGMSRSPDVLPFRVAGMILTFASLALSALACLSLSLGVLKF
jgi:uncharacterized protein